MDSNEFQETVRNLLTGRVPENDFVWFGSSADGYNPNPFLYAERGDCGLTIEPNEPGRVGIAVSVQRFDLYKFGPAGWYCWFAFQDSRDGYENNWFAPPDATPETVAAVLLALYNNREQG